jgi:hypothetical protein
MARSRRSRVNAKGRNKGDVPYVNLPYELLNSEAWRTLSGPAIKVFLELRTRFNGGNNGKLHLSLQEAADLLGLGKATVQRAFDDLKERGLVVCTKRGQWYGRRASEWAVFDKAVDGGPPSYAWKQWRPPGPPRPSVLKWTQKTKRGFRADPSGGATGPIQNPEPIDGSDTELVRPLRVVGIGSGTDR